MFKKPKYNERKQTKLYLGKRRVKVRTKEKKGAQVKVWVDGIKGCEGSVEW